MEFDWVLVGGLAAGGLAGFAARFGKLCTMGAIEDALVAGNLSRLRAWGISLSVAALMVAMLEGVGQLDVSSSAHTSPRLHLLGLILGGLLFGLGMSLVGTCSFGLLVRAGGGDLRAGITAMIVGVFAMAVTAGALSSPREALLGYGTLDLTAIDGPRLGSIIARLAGTDAAVAAISALILAPVAFGSIDRHLWQRPRLVAGSVTMGLAIAVGWWTSWQAVQAMSLVRPESLSFVAPSGRVLLQFMTDSMRGVGFGVAAMVGVVAASCLTAVWRDEFRLEAFDDSHEMLRHMVGAALMGIGGVLAGGCTIGQGLTASSILAIGAPIFLASVFIGAKAGLNYLLGGRGS